MMYLAPVLTRVDQNLNSSLDRLFDLLRIKSISTDRDYRAECEKAANWLVVYLQSIGFQASSRETPGHPIVIAHCLDAAPGAPHFTFYGHYDVQPVDPIDLWDSDPFEPSVKETPIGSKIITGRGTSDDKGQLMTFLEACRAYHETYGQLPCRVTILFEGEEESGSPSLVSFLEANAEEIRAEYALVCDTGMWDRQTPAIPVTLRGLVCEEVIVTAADRDLHSGLFGGVAANPVHILVQALAGLHDDTGRITLKGFYDGVEETPADVKASWDALGRTAENFLGMVGLSIPSGEKGRSVTELTWARPTAEINGIQGGYSGDGFKTIIPHTASAKVSFRLVGTQNPHQIRECFQQYMRAHIPDDCSVEFHAYGSAPATRLAYDSPVLAKARTALLEEWSRPAVVTGIGGSIPVVGHFLQILGMESLLVGFSLADDAVHSPNEKYELVSFHKGIRSWVRILHALAA
jgi:acetylornithine deacetylase/succinyl-diaminopimelate desuccinylase-like protein